MTQAEQVIQVMREAGGIATFGKLNSLIDCSKWKTKSPEASIRRIVQENPAFFKIKPGLWALTESRDSMLAKTGLTKANDKKKDNEFSHSYFQGLVVEIGNMKNMNTYIPAQDKNKLFIDKPLKAVATLDKIYEFAYQSILRRASTVDVIWFNDRNMPAAFFEIEHSTDIQNSLLKYCDLQDYCADFYIVADKVRQRLFEEILARAPFNPIKKRVRFIDYEKLSTQHEAMYKMAKLYVL